jgi:hypothetical protein
MKKVKLLQKKTNDNAEKVKITKRIIHYIPCSTSQKRQKGWDTVRVYDWGKIRTFAIETINLSDLFILIAIVKAFQNFEYTTKDGEIRGDKPTITLTLKFWFFVDEYLGTHDTEFVRRSLQRLISWKVIFIQNNGNENPQEYLIDYKIFEKEGVKHITFVLNKIFHNACKNKGLLINFDAFKKIKSNQTRALFIYLEGRRNAKSFYQSTLEKVLELGKTNMPSYVKRAEIKKTFNILKNNFLIQDFTCRKKNGDYLFTFS